MGPKTTQSSDPRRFIQRWHHNDPEYTRIVSGITLATRYSRNLDARMEELASGVGGDPLLRTNVASSVRGCRDHQPETPDAEILKQIIDSVEMSLAESEERYKKIYESRGVETLKEMCKTLDDIVDSHAPHNREMDIALKFKNDIENGLRRVCNMKRFRDLGLELTLTSYGSRASYLHGQHSDIDFAILGTFGSSTEDIKSLDEFGRKNQGKLFYTLEAYLRKTCKYSVQTILRTRVPLIKVFDAKSGLESDVCISKDVRKYPKSELLLCLNMVDARFRMLVLLVKTWAKHNAIQDASIGRFNSYSLTSLVIFHLQSRPSPILPPLKDILPPRGATAGKIACDSRSGVIKNMVKGLKSWKERAECNSESILELFVSFLLLLQGLFTPQEGCKHSKEDSKRTSKPMEHMNHGLLLQHMRVSTYHGHVYFSGNLKNIVSKAQSRNQRGVLFIEDPFDLDDNSARALTSKCLQALSKVIKKSLNSCMKDSIDIWSRQVFGRKASLSPKNISINPWASQRVQDSERRAKVSVTKIGKSRSDSALKGNEKGKHVEAHLNVEKKKKETKKKKANTSSSNGSHSQVHDVPATSLQPSQVPSQAISSEVNKKKNKKKKKKRNQPQPKTDKAKSSTEEKKSNPQPKADRAKSSTEEKKSNPQRRRKSNAKMKSAGKSANAETTSSIKISGNLVGAN